MPLFPTTSPTVSGEHVAVYHSVLRHRGGAYRAVELGARWGTWGARAVALLRLVKPEVNYEAPGKLGEPGEVWGKLGWKLGLVKVKLDEIDSNFWKLGVFVWKGEDETDMFWTGRCWSWGCVLSRCSSEVFQSGFWKGWDVFPMWLWLVTNMFWTDSSIIWRSYWWFLGMMFCAAIVHPSLGLLSWGLDCEVTWKFLCGLFWLTSDTVH